jgi:hypothetical protein
MGQRLRMVGFLVKCRTVVVGIGYSWIVIRSSLRDGTLRRGHAYGI